MAPATSVADAKVSREQLEQVMEMLDRDKDGSVTAEEFKIPWLKLFPKLKEADFMEAWKQIDANGDGNLSMNELATYYGYDLNKNDDDQEEMSDEKILEALAMQAALVEMEEAAAKRKAEKEEAEAKSKKGTSGGLRRTSSTKGSGGSMGGRDKHRSSSGVIVIKMPAKVTEAIEDKNILFMQGCELGDTKAVLKMLEEDKGFSGRVEDDKGEMPLHKLSRYQNSKDVIRELIDRASKTESIKTDLNWQDKQGKTPLFYAAEYGNKELALLFLDRGADPFIENNNGSTVVHCAVNADKYDVVEDILRHPKVSPADGSTSIKKQLLNTADKSKRTPLHIAAFKSKEGEMVQLLLKHGADPSLQDANGNTSAKLANKTGRRKSKELLDEAEAKANAK